MLKYFCLVLERGLENQTSWKVDDTNLKIGRDLEEGGVSNDTDFDDVCFVELERKSFFIVVHSSGFAGMEKSSNQAILCIRFPCLNRAE